MWNYQQILFRLNAALVVEFGTFNGGSALYFAEILQSISPGARVITIDINHANVADRVRRHPHIELMTVDSTSEIVASRILDLRRELPGKVFFIVDSDHHKEHVFRELMQLRSITRTGDYVIVERWKPEWTPSSPRLGRRTL